MRLGLFGGTFNPVHLGHMELAQNVKDTFCLDEVTFIPSKQPPHKTAIGADSDQRLKMVKLAVGELGAGFNVSDYEINSEGVSYTYRTLLHWRGLYPEDEIFFIAGSDIFATIQTWHNWQELFNLANFIVVNRDSKNFEDMLAEIPTSLQSRVSSGCSLSSKAGKIFLYEMKYIHISSTLIRNGAWSFLKSDLPQSVYNYIIENNLYIREK